MAPPQGMPLFDKIVALSGVSVVLAPGLVRRALIDGPPSESVIPEKATVAHYRAALPRLLARLKAYMQEDEAVRRGRRIAAALALLESGGSLDAIEEEATSIQKRVPIKGGKASGPSAAQPAPNVDVPAGDDTTLFGRRYTEAERELLRKNGIDVPDPEKSEPAPASPPRARIGKR